MQRISGPAELLQAIPYLLGFHPEASLVLVGLDSGRLVVTARLDLNDVEMGGVEHALSVMGGGGASSVVAVVYDDEAPPDVPGRPFGRVVRTVERVAEQVDCDLLEVLLAARGRWWSLTCDSKDCCPPEGRELPAAPSAFAAAAAYDGVAVLPSRAALESLFDPVAEDERQRLEGAIAAEEHAAFEAVTGGHGHRYERSIKRALFAAARDSVEPRWQGCPDGAVARFGAALSNKAVRDAVWIAVDDERLDGRPLWRALARRLPSPYDAAPLFLFGWASWRAGEGTLAGIAAERTVASDPAYTAGDLLLAAVASGADPRRVPKLRLPRTA